MVANSRVLDGKRLDLKDGEAITVTATEPGILKIGVTRINGRQRLYVVESSPGMSITFGPEQLTDAIRPA